MYGAEYTKAEVEEYKQLFSMFDTDGSGAIGNNELKQAMMSIGLNANDQEIDNLMREVDEDGNGEIDFAEFCACMKKSQSLVKTSNEEIIRQCFEIFDQDGNGVITESEFKYVAKEVGGFDEQLAELVFNELDISSNGHLTAEQFATIVDDYLLSNNDDIDSKKQQQQQNDNISDDVFSVCTSINQSLQP
uniref:Calmodulin n=1 Tax=Ascaris lumbricoides TaxID=6252 RepID=A0A0M3I3M0_ASCLU